MSAAASFPSTNPAVSVVIAVKNSAATLRACLESVLVQHLEPLEVLVIDGGSTDGSVEVIKAHADRLAYWCSEQDAGVYDAWNKAIARASGEWLCFLGADDRFHDPLALADLYAVARAVESDVRIVYGKLNLVSANGKVAETLGRPWEQCWQAFLDGVMIPHPGTLHRRSLFETRGPFDLSYRIAADYELFLRELLHGRAAFADRVVVDMRLGGMSMRPQGIQHSVREVLRARAEHGLHGRPAALWKVLVTSKIGAWIHRLLGDAAFRHLADGYRVLRGKPRVWTT